MTSNNENWDVIIVGAGPSGLGVGAQLAHAGRKVLVLEKDKGFGGRASTSSHAGMTFDNGPHAPMMAGDLRRSSTGSANRHLSWASSSRRPKCGTRARGPTSRTCTPTAR